MAKVDAEHIRKALKSVLLSDAFKQLVQDIYAEKDAANQYEEVKVIYPNSVFAPQDFPSGEIELGRGAKNQQNQAVHDVTFRITLYWHFVGSEEELLEDHLSRYARAVQDYFAVTDHLMPYAVNCTVWTGDEDYSPSTPHDDRGFVKSVAVDIFVRTFR